MRQVTGNPADWSSWLKSGNVETGDGNVLLSEPHGDELGPPPPLHPFLELQGRLQWAIVSHAVSAERLVPVVRSREGNTDHHQ
jgi:hypothetical protein